MGRVLASDPFNCTCVHPSTSPLSACVCAVLGRDGVGACVWGGGGWGVVTDRGLTSHFTSQID